MNADEFVLRLAELRPTEAGLLAQGISDASVIEALRSGYICSKRSEPGKSLTDDPVLDLLAHYQAAALEIGLVTMQDTPSYYPSRAQCEMIVFAGFDADYLAIDRKSGEVVLLDHGAPSHVMARAAKNGSAFLDALVVLTEQCHTSREPVSIRAACASIAGIPESVVFFELMC